MTAPEDITKLYLKQMPVYEKFGKDIVSILSYLLSSNDIWVQSITSRAKGLDSLLKKCERFPSLAKISKEGIIPFEDLAGARITLYLESDIDKVIGLIYNEFGTENIIEDKYKFSENGYNAHHLIVKLDKNRLLLSEYKQYSKMKLEIQVTTVLYHAWNEIFHDTLYKLKKDENNSFGAQYKAIEDELNQIVKDHIGPAQLELQTTYENFLSIKNEERVFSMLYLDQLKEPQSLNDLFSKLSILESNIRLYGNKFPKSINLVKELEVIYNNNQFAKEIPIDTPIGKLHGKSSKDILSKYLEILNLLIYQYPQEIIEKLFQLNKVEKEQAIKILEDFAKYDINILKFHGFCCQLWLLDHIEKLDQKNITENFEIVQKVLSKILSSSYVGTEMTDYRSMRISSGGLSVNDNLKKIRERAIKILFNLFLSQEDISNKIIIVETLHSAMITANIGGNEALDVLVIENINKIITFFIPLILNLDYEVINEIEEKIFIVTNLQNTRDKFPNILEFTKLLKSNKEYQLFKLFYGFDYRFNKILDSEKDKQERRDNIFKILSSIKVKDFDVWVKRITLFSSNIDKTLNIRKYDSLFDFINRISTKYPEIGWELLKKENYKDVNWKLNIISGLWRSKDHNKIRKMIFTWIKLGKNIEVLTYLLQNTVVDYKKTDMIGKDGLEVLNSLFRWLKKNSDMRYLMNNLLSSLLIYQSTAETRVLFFKIICELNEIRNSNWTGLSYKLREFLTKPLESECNAIISNLVYKESLNFNEEEILRIISENFPTKVIDLFEIRLKRKIELRKKDYFTRYDPIPFIFSDKELIDNMVKSEKEVIEIIAKWFSRTDLLYKWEASRLIYNLFGLSNYIKKYILGLINKNSETSTRTVLYIMEPYIENKDILSKNISFILSISEQIVKIYHKDNGLMGTLKSILTRTGVVTGEFGLSEAFEKRRQQIKPLLSNKDANVKEFFIDFDEQLKVMAISESKHSKLSTNRARKGLI